MQWKSAYIYILVHKSVNLNDEIELDGADMTT